MQEISSPPMEPTILSLREFLTALIRSFEKHGIRPCVLRNYEGFPVTNIGRDIDFLIHPSDLPLVIRALRSIQGIRIVGYAERCYAAHFYIEGVSAAPGVRTLQVDFMWCLNWKGLAYLSTEAVLQGARPWRGGDLDFLVPSPTHEAIVSLLSSLLVGGWLREKYFPKVQQTFIDDRMAATTALSSEFGLRTATRLVDSVIEGDRARILDCIKSLRLSIGLRGLWHRPVRGMLDIIRYYSHEFVLRYSPRTLEKVCILGPGGSGRVEIATFLASMLQYSAGAVEVRQCGQESSLERESTAKSLDAESLAETPNRSRVSLPIVVKWMFKEWLKEFSKSRNLTLHITEDCYDDSLIATQWRRGSYLAWLVRLFAKIVPSHDLWILLDQHARDSQSKEPRGPMRKTDESFEACLAFVKTKCRQAILDASASTAEVTEEAYSAIIDTLARRAGDVIEKRFKLARDAGRQ